MFGKVMTSVVMRQADTLSLRIAEVERVFSIALAAERSGDKRKAEHHLLLALELEAQAFA